MSFDSKSLIKTDHLLAVVGLGLTVPGANNVEQFWETILAGENFFSQALPEDFGTDPAKFLAPAPPALDKVYSLAGAFNRAQPSRALRKVTADWDTTSRYLMEAAWETLKLTDLKSPSPLLAGHNPHQIGLIVGQVVLPTRETARGAAATLGRAWADKLGLESPATLPNFQPSATFETVGTSARQVAGALGFSGPAFTVDAACASSLYALKLASLELLEKRLSAVVVGGVAAPDRLFTQMGFCQLRALSPSGASRPFDEQADGLVVGEGAGLLLLKRLDRALADGDLPLALIRGVGLSNDQGSGLLAPEKDGQVRAMNQAWQEAGLNGLTPDLAGVGLIEAHGTGTPVGDEVELAALKEFWKSSKPAPGPVLGSVKGNIGHLLSAAGALGLIKSVLALKHQLLPPSGGFNNLSPALKLGIFRILKTGLAWPSPPSGPRRAVVNAFGFGGANAQVVLEEFNKETVSSRKSAALKTTPKQEQPNLVVVGLATVGGDAEGRRNQDKIVLDALAYRTSPKELRALLPQQALTLKVAHDLWDQLNLTEENLNLERLGLFVGVDLDPQASDYALRWLWAEPAFKQAAAAKNPALPKSLEAFKDALTLPLDADGTVGALGSIAASRPAKFLRAGGPAFTLSSGRDSGLTALRAAAGFLRTGLLDMALVGAVDTPGDLKRTLASPETSRLSGAAMLALTTRELAETWNLPVWAEYNHEKPEPGNIVRLPEDEPLKAGAAAGLFHLAGGLDLLARGLKPQPSSPPVPWMADAHKGPRGLEISPDSPHEPPVWLTAPKRPLVYFDQARLGPVWFFLPCLNQPDELKELEKLAGDATCLLELARRHWLEQAYPAKTWKLALSASSLDDLKTLLAEMNQAWSQGEQFSHHRVLRSLEKPINGGLALVFPGSGNQYPKMSLPWAEAAPGAVAELMSESDYLASQFQPDLFLKSPEKPRSPTVQEAILGQVSLNSLVYKILKKVNLKVTATLGYSLGESAALVATGAWDNRDELFLRLKKSSLFTKDLAGDYLAAREYWGLPPGEPLEWSVAVAGVSFSQFQTAWSALPLELQERVFLLLINTQEECVVGGESRAVEALGRLLNKRLLPLSGVAAVHNSSVQIVAERYRALHLIKVSGHDNIKYYSPARGRAYTLTSEAAADSITEQALSGHNFVRLINQAHQDGIRHFLEMGPGGSATRMIKSILKNRAYRAYSLDAPGAADLGPAIRTLAELTLQEKPINWAALYAKPALKPEREPGLPVELTLKRPLPGWSELGNHSGQTDGHAVDAGEGRQARPYAKSPLEVMPSADKAEHNRPDAFGETITVMTECSRGEATNLTRKRGRPKKDEGPADFIKAGAAAVERISGGDGLASNQAVIKVSEPATGGGSRRQPLANPPAAGGVTRQGSKGKATRGRPRKLSLDDQWAAVGVITAKPGKESNRLRGWTSANSAPPPEAFCENTESKPELLIQALREEPEKGEWANEVAETDHSYWQWLTAFDGLSQVAENQKTLPLSAAEPPRSFSRAACLAFAVGAIAEVLGPQYAEIDRHPTRVRLPDEPLMLVDRILEIEGTPLKPGAARIVTEHDVLPEGGWYLESGHMPASLAVESGQADLFLAAFLGLDFITKGLARYRLLDAEVTIFRELPQAGETVNYDIRILRFFKHGQTHLFRFEFDATINGRLVLTMRNGCAGFFTPDELASGKGLPALLPAGGRGEAEVDYCREAALAPLDNLAQLNNLQMDALRRGDLREAFGVDFSGLSLNDPLTLPGGRLALIDRISEISLTGGHYGQGLIRAEADIDPNAWFLTCHFIDDQVMPGTLMFEGCLHTLRTFLLRLGWVSEKQNLSWQPVAQLKAGLKCRGQVTALTKTVAYEVHLKELGFNPEPYALAEAVMYADDRPIVHLTGLSLRLLGASREKLSRQWAQAAKKNAAAAQLPEAKAPAVFEKEQLDAFTEGGPPSALFGPIYKPLDQERFVARLPRGDYALMDRVLKVETSAGCLMAGQALWAEFQSRADAWYMLEAGGREPRLPYAILNEIALQPCGFLAAYMGSALDSSEPMHFRNLGGQARLLTADNPAAERLLTRAEVTKISQAGDMIIEHFDFQVFTGQGKAVYEGRTYFGFFTPKALAAQSGLSGDEDGSAKLLHAFNSGVTQPVDLSGPAWPQGRLALLDRIEMCVNPEGLPTLVRGEVAINPDAWFFHDHFYQDPVWPGSLGLESFWLLGKAAALEVWGPRTGLNQEQISWQAPRPDSTQEWIYRGQVIPGNREATVIAEISGLDHATRSLVVTGYLLTDGRPIYKVKNFRLALAG